MDKKVEFFLEKYFVYFCRNKILFDENRYWDSKQPKLSIIIPVYNRAEYIENIIISIQNQNIKDIEIIFVGDMSKDTSIEIIEKFMKEDVVLFIKKYEE